MPFALSDAELALACASHSGEPAHVATAQGWLARLGLTAEHLECGTQWPAREPVLRALAARGEVAGPLHNNCSGKHCGFLCLACHLCPRSGDAEPAGFARGYVAPEHPVMREVTRALELTTGQDLARAPRGIDGCSIPTYALPFARTGAGLCTRARAAGAARCGHRRRAAAPGRGQGAFHGGGTDRFDTQVMQAPGRAAVLQGGAAEGVYCASLPELGLGLALKIEDGASRAAEALMAEIALQLLRPSGETATLPHRLAAPVLHNWRGTEVGRLRVRLGH